jgi:hypothetical protein
VDLYRNTERALQKKKKNTKRKSKTADLHDKALVPKMNFRQWIVWVCAGMCFVFIRFSS